MVTDVADAVVLNESSDSFVNGLSQNTKAMTLVIYFASHAVEKDGLLHLCMCHAGDLTSNCCGLVPAAKLTQDLVAKILAQTGPSKKLTCIALWDCCRRRLPGVSTHIRGRSVGDMGNIKHQHGEIRSCLLNR